MPSHSTWKLIGAAGGQVIAFVIGAAGTSIVFLSVVSADEILQQFLLLALSVVIGALLARLMRRLLRVARKDHLFSPRSPITQLALRSRSVRVLLVMLLTAYAVTWVFGVPAVLTASTDADLAANLRAVEYYNIPWVDLDTGATFAMPLTPGVIVLYHYHEGGKLHGWGGWKIYLWYGTGHKELLQRVSWVT